MGTGHAQCGVHDLGGTSNLDAMNEAWTVLIGVTGTLLGGSWDSCTRCVLNNFNGVARIFADANSASMLQR
jgi:hypothetical protein